MSAPQFPKVCTKCRALISAEEWGGLPLVGEMKDEVETLELRNHDCATTLAVRTAGGES